MLRDGFLLLYCASIGFVASGITASFYKMITSQPARFALLGEGSFGIATTFAFCALTGPAIIVEQAIRTWTARSNTLPWLFASFGIASLWSACSGVLMVELIFTVGGI